MFRTNSYNIDKLIVPSKKPDKRTSLTSLIALILSIISLIWTIYSQIHTENISQAKAVTGWLYPDSLPILPATSSNGGVKVKASTDTNSYTKNYHGFVINNTSSAPIYNVLIFVADLTKSVESASQEKSVNKYSPRYISIVSPEKKFVYINEDIDNRLLKYGVAFFFCDTEQHYWLRTQHGKLISTTKSEVSSFIKNNKMKIDNTNVYTK